jgi:hypothetical protein
MLRDSLSRFLTTGKHLTFEIKPSPNKKLDASAIRSNAIQHLQFATTDLLVKI